MSAGGTLSTRQLLRTISHYMHHVLNDSNHMFEIHVVCTLQVHCNAPIYIYIFIYLFSSPFVFSTSKVVPCARNKGIWKREA
jgi:hypothetical protein